MNRHVTFENNPLTLIGRRLSVDAVAPACTLTNNEIEEITLDSFGDRVKLVHFFASLDTPVCDLQVREFDRRAGSLEATQTGGRGPVADGGLEKPGGLFKPPIVLGISMDLPFAHKRFSETFGIRNTVLLSDYRYASFGINYGVLIKEWNLLARGCVIIDRENAIRYIQLVDEISNPPDFDDAFTNLRGVLEHSGPAHPGGAAREAIVEKAPPLPRDALGPMLERVPGWEIVDGTKIAKKFRFMNFAEAKQFLDILSRIAEEHSHHPSFSLDYNRLRVTLTTHSAGGLTKNDFIMAGIINQLS